MENKQTTEERDKKIIQLASLVGTDAKNPEEKLLDFINSEKALAIAEERKRIVEEVKKRSSYFKRVVSEWGDTYTDTVKGITEEDLLSLISKDNLQDKEN